MKILVTGGTGVIGVGTIPELLKRGHHVRLLSRGAESDAADYPQNVEPFPANVTDPESLHGAADGCDAMLHIAGIVDEKPPRLTFRAVNVDGTKHMLAEATRAGVRRFIFVSSLGAEHGTSPYHLSKRMAEDLVTHSCLDWTILRPGNVYGPGDDVISMLLKLVRSLPVVPVVDQGEQRFQPIWFEDLGKAVAETLERDKSVRKILEVAGKETTTTREVIEKLGEITGRSPLSVPVPAMVASAAARLAEQFASIDKLLERSGLAMPISSNKLQMLLEENYIREPAENALTGLFSIQPVPLETGLRLLAEDLPELLPDEGVGAMERKRFEVEIEGSKFNASELLSHIREHLGDLMPIEFEAQSGSPEDVHENKTFTGKIPGRGQIQVRAVEVKDHSLTFLTVEGHPLAGSVTFRTADSEDSAVRFTIEINARAANALDWIAMRTVGRPMQSANWQTVATRVVELSGGQARHGISEHNERLSPQAAEGVTHHLATLARENTRRENTVR